MNINQLIYQATLAPSGHNTQPWKFSVDENIIRIYPDFQRSLPVVDPDNHALYISLGCALENLVISAKQDGLTRTVEYFPEDEREECIRVTLTEENTQKEQELFDAISVRQSNRSMYDVRKIPPADVEKLLKSNIYKTVSVKPFDTKNSEAEPIIELVKEASRIQFNDQEFVEELISWMRFTKRDVKNKKDGLTAKVMGFPYVPKWVGRLIIKTFAKPESEASKAEKQIRSSSHMMLFICKNNDKKSWVDIGRSFQRVVLTATSLGIAHAHLNMPCEVESMSRKLSKHLGLDHGERPILLIRLGYAEEIPRSPRRSVDDVLINQKGE